MKRICSIDGCPRPHEARGFCKLHYERYRRHGEPGKLGLLYTYATGSTPQERFLSRLSAPDENGCINWLGNVDTDGYGQLSLNNKTHKVHRMAWFYATGKHPTLCVLHSCDNPRCCNIEHLREGTHQDNMDDKVARGRVSQGESTSRSKLTATQVIAIRSLLADGASQRSLAKMFNVSWGSIHFIKKGCTWQSVK